MGVCALDLDLDGGQGTAKRESLHLLTSRKRKGEAYCQRDRLLERMKLMLLETRVARSPRHRNSHTRLRQARDRLSRA
jgi:hypothetical protein